MGLTTSFAKFTSISRSRAFAGRADAGVRAYSDCADVGRGPARAGSDRQYPRVYHMVSVCSFTGEPKLDKLDQDDFARALFYCAEAKTFDGLVAAKDRVERFITHDFFLAIKTQTTVQMLWDQCDALAGFH